MLPWLLSRSTITMISHGRWQTEDSTRQDLVEILQFRLHNLIVCHLTQRGVEFCFRKTAGGLALRGCSTQVCVHSLTPRNCRGTRHGDPRFVEQCLFWQQPFLCVSAGHARASLLAQSMHKHLRQNPAPLWLFRAVARVFKAFTRVFYHTSHSQLKRTLFLFISSPDILLRVRCDN